MDINGDAHRTTGASSSSPSFTSTRNRFVAVDPKDPSTCSTSSAAKPSQAGDDRAAGSSGFPLTGFLKLEVIGLAEAEVTFRPGDARLAALVVKKEAAEEVEREVSTGSENIFQLLPSASLRLRLRLRLQLIFPTEKGCGTSVFSSDRSYL